MGWFLAVPRGSGGERTAGKRDDVGQEAGGHVKLLGSKFSRATLGWVLARFELRKIDNHLRALFGIPPSEWAPWVPDWYIRKYEEWVSGNYRRAKSSNQRTLVAHFECSAEDAEIMEENLSKAFEVALRGEKMGDIDELLPDEVILERDFPSTGPHRGVTATRKVLLRTPRRRP